MIEKLVAGIEKGYRMQTLLGVTGSGKTLAVTRSIAGRVLSIKPNANPAYNTTYTVTVPAGAVLGLADNRLASTYTFSFTTAAPPSQTGSVSGRVILQGRSSHADVTVSLAGEAGMPPTPLVPMAPSGLPALPQARIH